jgi:CHASE1-domain containing sensor protein
MVTYRYVLIVLDERGEEIERKDADADIKALKQRIVDLQELLDATRRIALEANDKIIRGE